MNKNRHLFSLLFLYAVLLMCLASPVQAVSRSLVLFPLTIYAEAPKPFLRQGLKAMFQSRLAGGGLEVLTEDSYDPLLTDAEKKGNLTKARAEELARKLKADYAVFGSVTTLGGGSSLDLSFLDLTKTPPKMTSVSEAVKEEEFIPKIAEVANRFRAIIEGRYVATPGLVGAPAPRADTESTGNLFARLGRPGASGIGDEGEGFFRPTRQPAGFRPTGSLSLQMTVMAFDAGDLNGKGELELVVLGRKELRLYTRKDKTYRLTDSLKATLGEDFLKVSVGDVDGNGKAEIYLVSRYGIRARSTVYEWNGKFKRLYRRSGHLRAVKDSRGGKPLLLFQESKVDAFSGGDIWTMAYAKGTKATKSGRLPRLKDARFYTVMPFDLVKGGERGFVGLGDGNVLRVWESKGSELWGDEKEIGGSNNAIRVGKSEPGEPKPRIVFNGRLVFTDIDGDGKKEVIAVKNIPMVEHLQDFKVFIKSRLIAYKHQGTALSPGWDTREINYCLVDIQEAKKTLFLAAHKGKISDLFKGSSRIMWFDLQ